MTYNIQRRALCVRILQADINASNFGVDEQGNTVLMDFGDVSLLPETFTRLTYSANIGDTVALKCSANMESMSKISYALGMTVDPELGASTCI